MSIKIAAVCDNSLLGMALKKYGEAILVEIEYPFKLLIMVSCVSPSLIEMAFLFVYFK